MSQEETPPNETGFTIKDTLAYLKDSSGDYLRAKVELASLEAKEAANESIRRIIYAAVLAFFGIFSYLLLLASIIGACTHALAGKLGQIEVMIGTWPLVTLALLFIHLLIVFVFLDKLKTASKKALFPHTKAELKKDTLWLQQIKTNKGN